MYPFWSYLVEPALSLLQPKRIVEIGSEDGFTTQRLLGFCQKYGAVLHAVDPAPKFDVQQYRQRFAGHFEFHAETSLAALPKMEPCDVILIDGDHNWYTVFHELKTIEDRCRQTGAEFPLAFLHDVGWPYGRRDLYYDPGTIPAEFRQPYARAGIRPGVSQLQEKGGLNAHLANATAEGTPRNGVLTAVEDFVNEAAKSQLELSGVPGLAGLAVLRPSSLRRRHPKLSAFLDSWHLPKYVRAHIARVEEYRVKSMIRALDNAAAFRRSQAEQTQRIEQLQATVEALTSELAAAKNELAELESSSLEPKASGQTPAAEQP